MSSSEQPPAASAGKSHESWVNVTGYPISVCDARGNQVFEIGEAATVIDVEYGPSSLLRTAQGHGVPVVEEYTAVRARALFRGTEVDIASVATPGSFLIVRREVAPLLLSMPHAQCPFGILVPNTMATESELRPHRCKRMFGAFSFVRSMVQLKANVFETPEASVRPAGDANRNLTQTPSEVHQAASQGDVGHADEMFF